MIFDTFWGGWVVGIVTGWSVRSLLQAIRDVRRLRREIARQQK